MDNESTFVAPEGVWTLTEQHIPPIIQSHLPSTQQLYPTRISTISVKFPAKGGAQGFTSLLGGGGKAKDSEKDKRDLKDKKAGYEDSVSSSEGQDDGPSDLPMDPDLERERDPSPLQQPLPASLFSPGPDTPLNKKKSVRRPKHNIRTTSSSFVTRIQSAEGLNKILANKVGETTFLFYNAAKSFFWTEVGTKSKVRWHCCARHLWCLKRYIAGPPHSDYIFGTPYMPCNKCNDRK